ncbi:WD repeat and HMG-box DNA-binding protein 1 isoform X1 [Parasteatoda tepidariorum]|uniref:WD repeat and HMG-box DNA-binding protein 1 isoform X1 n=2 Tax=Parasteatoda tepidariorum TaxID=114398 RepID=UPI001C71B014|nr:WD repeat and HMG-box DNA-binding protein 1 isoform X1 [Parasteatoda tepidariorum]
MDDLSMRFAHSNGFTDVCFEDTGNYIISCGNDGDIRVYNGFEDGDPETYALGKNVSSVAFSNDVLYAAINGKFTVSAYSFPSIEFEQIIAQFNTIVYHVVCSKNGNLVASGGGDFIVKVYDTSNKTLTAFRDHTGPILSLAVDPRETFLGSSSCDGTVRIWHVAEQKCLKILNILKKSNDLCTTSSLYRMDWSPDGQYLAIPVDTEIKFYQRESWDVSFTLTDKCMLKDISIVTFSPFGNYIAAAAINGQLAVWDTKSKKCVSRKPHENEVAVTALKWNPSGQDLVFCDVEGQMGIYTCPLTSSQEITDDVSHASHSMLDSFAAEDNDIEDDNSENAFDIGAIKASLDSKIFNEESAMETASVKSEIIEPKIQVVEAPKAPVQAAFQPSSTPINLEHRFMLWNNVGIVRCYNTEEENSIDVEFHDASVYHPLHLTNTRNHTLAALSSEALLLGCPKQDENTSSKLECLHFSTWDSNKEWIVEMPETEEIEAITLGEGFAACVTDKRFVRLFSISGVQCEVFSIPGPVVCCAAKSNQLLIVYHKGTGISGDQNLGIMIVKVNLGIQCSMKECFIPLNSKAFLSWLGFSDEGHPCIVDTSGVIQLLNVSCGSKWIPIANTTLNIKNKSDTCFVVGLSEIKQEVRYILCKGSRYPALLPRPTISVLSFILPFCEMSSDKGKLEEENQRYALAHRCLDSLLKEGYEVDSEFQSVEKKWMDALLKLFALATRSDREYRALDVAELMPNPAVIQGAIRYATQRHRIALAERLGEVMNKKLNQEDETIEEELDLLPSEEFSESLIADKSAMENFNNSIAKEDSVLKPKSLSRIKNQIEKNSESFEDTVDITANASIPSNNLFIASKSSPSSNPFKSNSKSQAKKEENSNLNGIDDLLNNSMKSVTSKSSNSTLEEKPKKSRFDITKKASPNNAEKKKTGFNLYFEENVDEIKASEAPDISEKEIVQIAMKLYRALPQSEKQKYMKPSTASKSTSEQSNISAETKENFSKIQNVDKDSAPKRKESSLESEDTPKSKKVKTNSSKPADSTLRKLTQYAFTKTQK